jgi:hypothetical protein
MTTATALQILAETIKSARCYSVNIRSEYGCIEVSSKKSKAHACLVEKILNNADMNGLFTVKEACGSVFVRPVIG